VSLRHQAKIIPKPQIWGTRDIRFAKRKGSTLYCVFPFFLQNIMVDLNVWESVVLYKKKYKKHKQGIYFLCRSFLFFFVQNDKPSL
jgi:hypothetical protein